MGDFKIRVVENIGEESKYYFGEAGTEHEVINGKCIDLSGTGWKEGGITFEDIETINDIFGEKDSFQTVFELVDESC